MSDREIGLREARKELGDLARAAHYSGQITTLTDNGKPIARIVPIEEPAMTSSDSVRIASASEWADALDAEMKHTGQDVGTLIRVGYANGQVCGIILDPEHSDADDERGVIASAQGWVVEYDAQSGYWTAR